VADMNSPKVVLVFFLVFSCISQADTRLVNSSALHNKAAFIPSQCYVKTEVNGKVFNTCYTCHTDSKAPNFMNDGDTQLEYAFNNYAKRNRWDNLFKDRTIEIAKISDQSIKNYVRKSNYTSEGSIFLADDLKNLPQDWDLNKNGKWDGYVPDSYFNFDEEGFDRNPKGGYTGWRSFVYVPFPGAFVPAAGSADDVLIRLPRVFQLNDAGEFDLSIYKLNLSIVEVLLKQMTIEVPQFNEHELKVDLDLNGKLNIAKSINFKSNAVDGSGMHYVGKAGLEHKQGELKLAAGLYPVGTEFLHSVRYLDAKNGAVSMAPRMKELRYAKKVGWASVSFQEQFALAEAQERELFPEQIPAVLGNHEEGVMNGLGWRFQGFIESASGRLRPQNYEEHVFCVGCHSAIGALHDSTFSFARKNNTYQQGWTSWAGTPVQLFFNEQEVKERFTEYFNEAGSVTDLSEKILEGMFELESLLPSIKDTWLLNKAYKTIVNEQSFVKGRDATLLPMNEIVHRVITGDQKTGITSEKVSAF
jgi:hypothetical protein